MSQLRLPLEMFLGSLLSALASARVDVSVYEMDHVCYRVETLERYQALAHAWRLYSSDVHESLVNGRPISVFTLEKPLLRAGRSISLIELPAPKEGSAFVEGWEHAEFVIDEPLEAFMVRHPGLVFDTKSMAKERNAELGLKLGSGIQAKFHRQSLAEVIRLERELGLALPPPC